MEHCESCKLPAETRYIAFYENVGMVFMRKSRSVKGHFCKSCIDYYFWNLTGKTMLVGWWGTISFILTPFILLNNIFWFMFTIGMEKPQFPIIPGPSLFWVLSAVGGFLFGGFLLSQLIFSILLSSFAQPTTYLQPKTTTQMPIPTGIVQDLPVTVVACIAWDEVTPQMAGDKVCVCDVIAKQEQNSQTGQTFLYSGKTDRFFLASVDDIASSLVGKCVCTSGVVQLNTDKTPYIDIGNDLDLCPY